MSIWMTRNDWRTCKREEVEVIRDYLFESWFREYEERKHQEQMQWELDSDLEKLEIKKYERARDAVSRAVDRF
jgi:hypothetical protein